MTVIIDHTSSEQNGRPLLGTKNLRRLVSRLKHPANSMELHVVYMTPAAAKEILRHNHPRQRRIKDKRINQYAADMQGEFWSLTHQAIAISVTGYLIDGQNRLEAVVLSGVAVPMVVITGVPEPAMKGVDYGASRTVLDLAKVEGEKILTDWPSIARRIYASTKSDKTYLTPQEAMTHVQRHRKALEFVYELMPKNIAGLTQAAVKAVICRAYYQPDLRPRLKDFVSVLLTGLPDNPKQDVAAIRLRNWLLEHFTRGKQSRARSRPTALIVYGKTENALKKFIDREPVEQLVETSQELFPIK